MTSDGPLSPSSTPLLSTRKIKTKILIDENEWASTWKKAKGYCLHEALGLQISRVECYASFSSTSLILKASL